MDACDLIADYLITRKQRTNLGMIKSLWADIIKGFLQATGLGPDYIPFPITPVVSQLQFKIA